MTDLRPLPSTLPLGKNAKLEDRQGRTLRVSNYTQHPSAIIPSGFDLTEGERDFGMMLNDRLGICGPAACGHLQQLWSRNAIGTMVTPSDQDIQRAYQDVGGYVPGKPDTDNGVYLLDLCKYFRNVGIAGHNVIAFAEVDTLDHGLLRYANTVFGGQLVGFGLPLTAQDQTIWDFVSETGRGKPWSWGGHATADAVFGMPGRAPREVITWGELQGYTLSFNDHYCDERYVFITEQWLDTMGRTPTGLDINRLMSDLAIVTAPQPSRTTIEKRNLVSTVARSYIGRSDPAPFWGRVGGRKPFPKSWCGGFAGAVLNEALGCSIKWHFATQTDKRSGFLYLLGRPKKTPDLGDVCYVDQPYQHHALVVGLDPIELCNGNGAGGKVALSGVPDRPHVFYPIESLL